MYRDAPCNGGILYKFVSCSIIRDKSIVPRSVYLVRWLFVRSRHCKVCPTHTGGKAKSDNREISSTIATVKNLKTDSESPSSVEKCRICCFLIEGNFVHNVFALNTIEPTYSDITAFYGTIRCYFKLILLIL